MTLYVPPHFQPEDPESMLQLIEAHAFGTLVSTGPEGLQVSHIPLLLDRGEGPVRLLGHVAVGNPHAQVLSSATQVIAIFQGPHAYVSPGWYAQHPAVPTWNYAVVHAHCRARMMDEAELHDLLVRLSNKYEDGRAKPWRAAELPAPFVASLLPAITGFELVVERLEGKFKLSQNRPAEIPRVIEALEREGEAELAGLMRQRVAPPKG